MNSNQYRELEDRVRELEEELKFSNAVANEEARLANILRKQLREANAEVNELLAEIKTLKGNVQTYIIMLDLEHEEAVESQSKVKELELEIKNGNRHFEMLMTKIDSLREIISQIEEKAFMWDGKDSKHYGNTIMKIIHSSWKARND